MSEQSYNEMLNWFATAESDAALQNREAGQTQFFPLWGKTQAQAYYRTAKNNANLIEVEIKNKQGKVFGSTVCMLKVFEERPSDQKAQFLWACGKSGVAV